MGVMDRVIDYQAGETVLKLQEARIRELKALIDACKAMTSMAKKSAGQVRTMTEEDLAKHEKILPDVARVNEQMQKALREARFDTTLV